MASPESLVHMEVASNLLAAQKRPTQRFQLRSTHIFRKAVNLVRRLPGVVRPPGQGKWQQPASSEELRSLAEQKARQNLEPVGGVSAAYHLQGDKSLHTANVWEARLNLRDHPRVEE